VAPGVLTPVSPTGSNLASGAKEYVWSSDPAATYYNLLVYKNGAKYYDNWYETAAMTVVSSNRVSINVSTNHTTGSYGWWVRAYGPHGTGDWSPAGNYTVR
jgi:hypothetical protein